MRRVITIDIETLPAASDSADPKTALNGDFGRILCIGFADEHEDGRSEEGVVGWDDRTRTLSVCERDMLVEFWDRMRGFSTNLDRVVGHNLFDFDLKFILKRSVILGVRPTVELSFARYRNQPIFDTMYEWERWSPGSRVKLDTLAKALGLRSSKEGGVDGGKVYDLFLKGEHEAIRDYCLADVTLTREIYRRMTFAEAPGPYAEPCRVDSWQASHF
jgi:DNA polymerase elongation subunit (family B)